MKPAQPKPSVPCIDAKPAVPAPKERKRLSKSSSVDIITASGEVFAVKKDVDVVVQWEGLYFHAVVVDVQRGLARVHYKVQIMVTLLVETEVRVDKRLRCCCVFDCGRSMLDPLSLSLIAEMGVSIGLCDGES